MIGMLLLVDGGIQPEDGSEPGPFYSNFGSGGKVWCRARRLALFVIISLAEITL